MGSFSSTCAVSGLPIEGGDSVRFLMLTRSPFSFGDKVAKPHVGGTDKWYPRVFPVRATYNDYGSVENVASGPLLDAWFMGLKRDQIARPVGRNKYHDVATPADLTLDQLLEALWEGRMRVRDLAADHMKRKRRYHPLPLAQAMIREDVYEALVAADPRHVEYLHNLARAVVPKLVEVAATADQLEGMAMGAPDWFHLALRMEPGEFVTGMQCPGVFGVGLTDSLAHFIQRMRAGDFNVASPEYHTGLFDMAAFVHVQRVLAETRHAWGPRGGGPQTGAWALHAKVTGAIARIAADTAERIAQREADDDAELVRNGQQK